MINIYHITKDGVKKTDSIVEAKQLAKDKGGLVWIDMHSFSQAEVQQVAKEFSLHRVSIKSMTDPYTRPHLTEFADHFHINFTLVELSKGMDVKPHEFHVFLGHDFIITATHNGGRKMVESVLDQYRETPTLAERGSYFALYLVVEALTDTYFPVAEKLDDEVDCLEDEMLASVDETSLQRLLFLKRQLFELRRFLGPQRDVYNELARRDFPYVQENYQLYFQDIYNRMIRVFDTMDTTRDVLTGAFDIYQSTVANRLNDIMKVLTVLATILGVLTLITGFFGMNFKHFPGLDATEAIPWLVAIMGAIVVGMLLLFRRMKWL
jgi:magnesium transporter